MTDSSVQKISIFALGSFELTEFSHSSHIQGGRPPPNDDGTPDETLFDQVIRLRQLMSSTLEADGIDLFWDLYVRPNVFRNYLVFSKYLKHNIPETPSY